MVRAGMWFMVVRLIVKQGFVALFKKALGKHQITLKKYMKFEKEREKWFRFQFCEPWKCPFECPVPKTQTPVILRLFKRSRIKTASPPWGSAKASSRGRRWCQKKAAVIVLFPTWLTIRVTPSLCPVQLGWSFPLALVRIGSNLTFV